MPGDDGAILTLHAGWRADSLFVAAGPSSGGPIHGGSVVIVRGACMDAAVLCGWSSRAGADNPDADDNDAASGEGVGSVVTDRDDRNAHGVPVLVVQS